MTAAALLAIDALLGAAPEPLQALDAVVATLGPALGVDRVVIFRVHDVPGLGLGQTVAAEWAGPGITGAIGTLPGEGLGLDATLREWSVRRRRGEPIEVLSRDLSGALRAEFERQAILSVYSEPIHVGGDWWGHVGVNDCTADRAWTDDERATVRLAARIVSRALKRGPAAAGLGEAVRAAMTSAAPDGIVVIDEDGCACEFNPAAEAMFGISREKILGRPIAGVITPHRLRAQHDAGFRRYIATGERKILGRRVATEGLRGDGSLFPIELTITEVKAEGRRLFAAYVRDLTALKEAEAALERQRENLHQSEKLNALGSLLAGVAHEMNNPLAVVVGRAVMLEEAATDAGMADSLRRLREAAERCARIAQSFLTIARKTPAQRRAVDVARPLRTALDLNAYGLKSSGVAISLAIAPKLPPVLADEDQLVQVFSNLVVNAEHAMRQAERRSLAISVTGRGDGVAIAVEDSGHGVPAALAGRIFDPFYTTKPVGMGTGIGLSVSRGMIEANGGTIVLEPRPGPGACFTVTLPAAPPAAPVTAEGRGAPATLAAHVLVVDDEPEIRALLTDMLGAAGCTVETASDGAEALARLSQRPRFDAVLADARMPVLDGLSLYRKAVASDPSLAGRFALVTGDTLFAAAGGDGPTVIAKPFALASIRAFLAGVLARHPT